MFATVTDLAEYRRTHPPALRCLSAMQRAWWNWATLPAVLAIRLFSRR